MLLRDVSQGLRGLLRTPMFTLVAAGTIALGIGASTAIFSVVSAVLLRPLPYPDAERLVLLWTDLEARSLPDFPWAPADFHDLRERGTLFEEVAGVATFRQTLAGEDGVGDPELIRFAGVTPNLLPLLGARLHMGRGLAERDAEPQTPPEPGAGAAAGQALPTIGVLSHGFWQRRYGGDPAVLGRTVEVNGQPLEIVGVLEPGLELLFPPGTDVEPVPDVWAAMRVDYAAGSRINVFLRVVAKLAPGASLEAARGQLDQLAADLRREFPIKETAGLRIRAEPMHENLVADVRPAVLALMGAVLFVLLIACANVANLLLVRSATRERELAVRAAMGGSRGRLLTQLLIEGLLLSVMGALAGLALAGLTMPALLALRPADLPRMDTVTIDGTVLAFTVLATGASAVVFGLVPALRASRADVAGALKESGRTSGLAAAGVLPSGVVVVEVALCFVLLIGSGLMLRSFAELHRTDPGFRAEGLLTFTAPARAEGDARAFMRQMQERLAALPGATAAAAVAPLPLDGSVANARWGTEAALTDPDLFQQANVHFVLPGYFEAMETPLLAGRTFTDADNLPEATGIVIDDVLARKAFGGRPAVGERLLVRVRGPEPEWLDVIGVVRQQRHETLGAEGREAIFLTDGQLNHGAAGTWVLRTSGDPLALASAVRAEVAAIDPRVAVAEVRPMTSLVGGATARTRFALVLIGTFALVAALLAAVGLYGVLSTTVRQRTPEIGVRLALGAEPGDIRRIFVTQGLRLSGVGIALGAVAALGFTRVVASLLVGVAPTDPSTYAGVAVFFLGVAALSSWLPAHRAARVDPTVALRRG